MISAVVVAPGPRRFAALALLALVSLAVPLSQAWAGGRRHVETMSAGADETWAYTFDVSEWSTGTHNVIVHARDRAGNEAVSGPFNLRVDPYAALPLVRVVYPADGDVIRQNISALGVASGRYGIERVFVRLNDGDEATAHGADYWESLLDFSGIPDGRHTLSVRALDSGGLYGPEERVSFVLDTAPPLVELTSHDVGDIISGNVTVRGRVSDASGIRGLYLSEDGVDFRPLSARGGRRAQALDFSFPVRTRNMDDGPVVRFVRAVDNTGLVTDKPVLLFVSNVPPALEILSPLPVDPVFNRFMLSGRAFSRVGIARLEYQWGRHRGEIEIRPGDPYWNVVLEHSPGTANSVAVTATDNAGNSVRIVQRLDDRRRDMAPSIVIDYPPAEVLDDMPPDTAIYGRVEGGFGPSRVLIGGTVYSVDAFPAFRIDPARLPPGRRGNLRLSAVDSHGVGGPALALRVTRAEGTFPVESFREESRVSVSSPGRGDWVAGGSFVLAGGASPGSRVQFRLSPRDPWQTLSLDEGGRFETEVTLPGAVQGPVHLELRAGDGFPVHHPFNRSPAAAPQVRFVSPSTEPDPDLPPRLVSGNRTVVGEVVHPVPIVGVEYSLDGEHFAGLPFAYCAGRIWFSYFCDFTALTADGGGLSFRVTDAAGTVFYLAPSYAINPEPPIPVIIVNSPVDYQLFTTPFTISGIAYDEVGIRSVHWRILGPTLESIAPGPAGDSARVVAQAFIENPDVAFNEVLTDRNFNIPVDFTMITDGEYVLEIFAADVYGVPSPVESRTIRISTSPPDTQIISPLITKFYGGTITIRSFSADANGIDTVSFSIDSGNTWQYVALQPDGFWELPLNTAIYTDGVHAALIRARDRYGVASFASAMINIDNTPPDLHISFPANGQNVGADMRIMGRVFDNNALDRLVFQVISLANPEYRLEFEREHPGGVVFENASLYGFPPGEYLVRVIARDLAGNESIVSREVTFGGGDAQIALFNPFPGETYSGPIGVVGMVTGSSVPDGVALVMDGRALGRADVDRFGIFRHYIDESLLADGRSHDIFAYYYADTGERVSSPVHTVFFSRFGPILTVDSHRDGDIITSRPWLYGRAWVSSEALEALEGDLHDEDFVPAGRAERRRVARDLALAGVQVSFDNGHTFRDARGGRGDADWRFRLETGELPAGHLPVLVRARFANGDEAVRRVMLYVDTSPPMVHTLAPSEGIAFRDSIPVYGIAGVFSENNNLAQVDVSLRTGDKMLYSVPGFLQGAFVDVKFFGATFFCVGFGLSFFDDNVRLQAQWGIAPSYGHQSTFVVGGRYTGNVFGIRLLANIFSLPFSWFFGPDWAFFSMNIAVGANFSWFSMACDVHDRSSLFMSAVVGQWDFVNVNMREIFPDWRFFRNFALYLQPELWFASSDVQGETIFRLTVGMRTNIF
ncbi:MAG: hypothetical protein FWB79_02430 [Treponema sp.]|nr:hypothetical protein [Treponema sp.]